MKRLILILIISLMPSIASPIALDKTAHALAGYGIAYTSIHYCEKRWSEPSVLCYIFGLAMATGIGVVKELADSQFDGNDILATGAGGFVGATMFIVIDF